MSKQKGLDWRFRQIIKLLFPMEEQKIYKMTEDILQEFFQKYDL